MLPLGMTIGLTPRGNTALSLLSATVNAAGDTLLLVFTRPAFLNFNDPVGISLSGSREIEITGYEGAEGLTTFEATFNADAPIYSDESFTLDIAANVFIDGSGNLLPEIVDFPVVNGSDVTYLFQDTFNRANSSLGGVGNSWSDPTTSFQILSNAAYAPTGAFAAKWLLRPSGLPANLTILGSGMTLDGDSTSNMLFVRGDSSNNGYICWAGDAGGTVIGLAKITGGSLADGFVTGPYSGSGGPYDVRLTVIGSIITAAIYAVGSSVPLGGVTLTNSAYASGTVGMIAFPDGQSCDSFTASVAPAYFLADGDSITAGHGGAISWSVRGGFCGSNIAVSGQTVADQISRYATYAQPVLQANPGATYWVGGGTNSLYFNASVATLQSQVTSLIASAVTDGAVVGVNTIMKRLDFPGGSTLPGDAAAQQAEFELRADAYNTWLRANYQSIGATYLADWAVALSDPSNTTYFQVDGVHPNNAGELVLAQTNAAAMA